MRTLRVFFIITAFFLSSIGAYPLQAQAVILPTPGVRVHLSPSYNPPILKGIKIHPENPFKFEFVLDVGAGLAPAQNNRATARVTPTDVKRLVKYFLASLTVPEQDLWVNLSPYEKNRIVPDAFGQTEMGRDLLAQDYMLKQITASLIYPEDEIGKKFWKRVYEEAAKQFGGSTEFALSKAEGLTINTFNKVWIVPEKAVVYENAKAGTAYVVESRLKIMLEQDYLALDVSSRAPQGRGDLLKNDKQIASSSSTSRNDTHSIASQIIREIVIPALTKEVNQGQNFAQLRQVYNSLILATWYKKKIKDSILSKAYVDQGKISGIRYEHSVIASTAKQSLIEHSIKDRHVVVRNAPPRDDTEGIYQQYLQAFKKGAYNLIKEEQDPVTQQMISRKYFSGGTSFTKKYFDPAMVETKNVSKAQLSSNNTIKRVEVDFTIDVTNSAINAYGKNNGINSDVDFAMLKEDAKSLIIDLKYDPNARRLSLGERELKELGVGSNNIVFLYPPTSVAIRVHLKPGIALDEMIQRFNALADLDIAPRIYGSGFIKNDPKEHYILFTDLIIGQSLDKMEKLENDDIDLMINLLSRMLYNQVYIPDFKINQFMIGYNTHSAVYYGIRRAWLVDAERAVRNNWSVVELAQYYAKIIRTKNNGFGWGRFNAKRILEFLDNVVISGHINSDKGELFRRAADVEKRILALKTVNQDYIKYILEIKNELKIEEMRAIASQHDISLEFFGKVCETLLEMLNLIRRNHGDISEAVQGAIIQEVRLFYAARHITIDNAQLVTHGGIDFKSDKLNVETKQTQGQGQMQLNIDPAMLKQLQDAPGLFPVIVNMENLDDVPKFLGVN